MVRKFLNTIFCVSILAFVLLLTSCDSGYKDPNEKNLMLHLGFDEGTGSIVKDKSKHMEDATIQYVFNNAQYKESEDPQWRDKGIAGGALLFDGYSNFVRYSEEEFCFAGSELSISAWVAPRAFEWDDPNGEKNGTDTLTAIVSQFNKDTNEGFVLGYQRHGRFSFQVGIGDMWITLWCAEDVQLSKYEWNHVAATFNGTTGEMRLYLNGMMVGEKLFFEGTKISPCYDYLLIGKSSEPGSNATASFNMVSGLMDEIKIYKKELTEAEVVDYFKSINVPEIEFEDIWLQNILTDDIFKTQYHGGPYQHWMNEPHAPAYYNGYYHLFFQFNIFGPYFRNICWGHLVSTDMVNWKPLKEVITPTAGTVAPDGVWSGGVSYDSNGVPVIFFTAGNDSFTQTPGLMSNQNIGIARPKDPTDPYLTEWVVDEELAIKQVSGQGRGGEFRDAHVWKEGDTWCLLVGSGSVYGSGGTSLLYTTTDDSFHNWQFKGQLYEMKDQPGDLGPVWELPVLLPIQNKAGTIQKYIYIISPAPADVADNDIYYWIGDFNLETGRFTPDPEFGAKPRLLDYGNNVFTGPSGFIDPVSGKVFVFSIMQDQRKPSDAYSSGWAHCVGLAREIYLNDEGTDACIKPVDALKNYEDQVLLDSKASMTVSEANQKLTNVKGDMLYIRIEYENVDATSFGIKLRQDTSKQQETILYYQETSKTVGVKTGLSGKQNISGNFFGKLELEEDKLVMEIYLDRSLVEAFFNEEKAISARIYPDKDSLGISLFAEGGDVKINSIYIASMKSIYE